MHLFYDRRIKVPLHFGSEVREKQLEDRKTSATGMAAVTFSCLIAD